MQEVYCFNSEMSSGLFLNACLYAFPLERGGTRKDFICFYIYVILYALYIKAPAKTTQTAIIAIVAIVIKNPLVF